MSFKKYTKTKFLFLRFFLVKIIVVGHHHLLFKVFMKWPMIVSPWNLCVVVLYSPLPHGEECAFLWKFICFLVVFHVYMFYWKKIKMVFKLQNHLQKWNNSHDRASLNLIYPIYYKQRITKNMSRFDPFFSSKKK